MLTEQVEMPAEAEFTFAEPVIEPGEELEIKMTADDTAITFNCRDCGKIYDIAAALGCGCFMCENCAMQYLVAESE